MQEAMDQQRLCLCELSGRILAEQGYQSSLADWSKACDVADVMNTSAESRCFSFLSEQRNLRH